MLRIHRAPVAAAGVLIFLFPWIAAWIPGLDNYPMVMVFAGMYCLLTMGLSLLMGYAGQISLGHAAFFGIGAYVSGVLTTHFELNPWLCMPVGAFVAAVVAIFIGAPSLKLKGHYLAMATLAFGIIVNIVFREELQWTGGPDGMVGIPGLALFGHSLDSITKYYYLVWCVVALGFLFTIRLIQSPVGRALRAIHTSQAAASAMGIDIARYKLMIFTYSAVLAAVAGSLYAHFMNFINPSSFDLFFSIKLIIMITLGGMHSIWGAMIGAILIAFLSFEWLHHFGEFEIVAYGVVLLVVTIFFPKGLAGLPHMVMQRIRRSA